MEMIPNPSVNDLTEVHLVPYSHTDFAWTNTRQWHIWRYIEAFKRVLEIMREDKDYTWCIDNVVHSWAAFRHYCPELVDEFRQRVKEGRISIANGGMSLARPVQTPEESFIRNMVEGKRYFCREFGLDEAELSFYLNADTGIGHTQVPQIISLAKHKYYRSCRPNYTMNTKGVPRQFRWKGLDGTEVLVARGEYGSFLCLGNDFMDTDDVDRDWEKVREGYWNEVKSASAANLTSSKLLLFAGCDDVMPKHSLFDKAIDQDGFIRAWNKHERSKIAYSTPERYFRSLEKDWDELPVWEGPLDQCELSYNASMKGMHSFWMARKALDRLIIRLESISSLLATYGVPYPEDDIRDLWSNQFEFLGHAIEFVIKQDNEMLWEKAQYAIYKAKMMIRAAEDKLATLIADARGYGFVVYNPTSQKRRGLAMLHITSPAGTDDFDIIDPQGNVLEYQVADIYTGDKNYPCAQNAIDVLVECEVPAMGYTTLRARMKPGAVAFIESEMTSNNPPLGHCYDDVTVDNGVFTATFRCGQLIKVNGADADMSGKIGTVMYTSVRPKSVGWEPSWVGQTEYEYIPTAWALVRSGPLQWIYRSEGTVADHKVRMDITINRGSSDIEFSARLDCAHDEGFFTCAFPCDKDTDLYADIPYGMEKRDMSVVPSSQKVCTPTDGNYYESAWHGQFFARNLALFRSGSHRAAILEDNELVYFSLRPDLGRISVLLNYQHDLLEKSNARPIRWVKQADESVNGDGVHTFRWALTFPGENDAFTRSAEALKRLQFPLSSTAVIGYKSQGNLPQSHSMIELDGKAIVTAAYRENGGYVVRLYECQGEAGDIRVTFNAPWTRCALTDLLGNAASALASEGQTVTVSARPWQIITLRFE